MTGNIHGRLNRCLDGTIKLENLNFHYSEDKEKLILKNFDIEIEKGTYLGIAGPSGCGKSSLIKAICKLEKTDGTIVLDLSLIHISEPTRP